MKHTIRRGRRFCRWWLKFDICKREEKDSLVAVYFHLVFICMANWILMQWVKKLAWVSAFILNWKWIRSGVPEAHNRKISRDTQANWTAAYMCAQAACSSSTSTMHSIWAMLSLFTISSTAVYISHSQYYEVWTHNIFPHDLYLQLIIQ